MRLVQRRWWLLTIATIAGNLAVFAIFLISLRAVGIGSSQITWIEAFAGWSLARILQLIPLTPGGLGPVELGLTGILVGLGGPNAAVVAAVLLYRAFTILPTLLVGSATIVGWRWLGPAREEGDPAPAGNVPTGEGAEPQGRDVRRAPRRLRATARPWRRLDARAARGRARAGGRRGHGSRGRRRRARPTSLRRVAGVPASSAETSALLEA